MPRRVMESAASALQAWTVVASLQQQRTVAVPPQQHAVAVLPQQQPGHLPPFNTIAPHSQLPAPQQHRPRCFFDASFSPASLKSTFGAVLLAPDSGFLAACAGPILDCFSPLMAKAAACKEVLSWLKNKGVLSFELCTDCSHLRSGLSAVRPIYYSYVGLFVDACKDLLSSFSHSVITLVPRTANVLAHALASAVSAQVSVLYWDMVPPDTISVLLN
nr:uncharacterized protein LOC109156284 [Ipomoea batatas]